MIIKKELEKMIKESALLRVLHFEELIAIDDLKPDTLIGRLAQTILDAGFKKEKEIMLCWKCGRQMEYHKLMIEGKQVKEWICPYCGCTIKDESKEG